MATAKILDPKKSSLISIILKNEETEEDINNLAKIIISKVKDKLKEEGDNNLKDKTYPLAVLLSSIVCDTMLHRQEADLILGTAPIHDTIVMSIILGMYIMNTMQKKNLKIFTSIEHIEQNVNDKLQRQITMQNIIAQLQPLGFSSSTILSILLAYNIIFEEDLSYFKLTEEEKENIIKNSKQIDSSALKDTIN